MLDDSRSLDSRFDQGLQVPQWQDNIYNAIEEECVFFILVPKYLVPESSSVTRSENSQTISTLNSEGLSRSRLLQRFLLKFRGTPQLYQLNLIRDISGKA